MLAESITDFTFIGWISLQSFSEYKRSVNPSGQSPHGTSWVMP